MHHGVSVLGSRGLFVEATLNLPEAQQALGLRLVNVPEIGSSKWE
jgi:hypothetical protein